MKTLDKVAAHYKVESVSSLVRLLQLIKEIYRGDARPMFDLNRINFHWETSREELFDCHSYHIKTVLRG